jgi:phosphate/sulfate permease
MYIKQKEVDFMKNYTKQVASKVSDLNLYKKKVLSIIVIDYLVVSMMSIVILSGYAYSVSPVLAVVAGLIAIGIAINAFVKLIIWAKVNKEITDRYII